MGSEGFAPNPSFPSQVLMGLLKLRRESGRYDGEEEGEERERKRVEEEKEGRRDDLLKMRGRDVDDVVMVFNIVLWFYLSVVCQLRNGGRNKNDGWLIWILRESIQVGFTNQTLSQ